MNREQVESKKLHHKFLAGELEGDELEQFELFLMDNPDFLETVELDALFLASDFKAVPKSESLLEKIWQVFNPKLATAFSVFALATLTYVFLPNDRGTVLTNVYSIELENLRSADSANRLPLVEVEKSNQVGLTFFLPDDYEEVQVDLLQQPTDSAEGCENSRDPVHSDTVALSDLSYVFLVPSKKVDFGNYLVCVSSSEGLINQYQINVVRE